MKKTLDAANRGGSYSFGDNGKRARGFNSGRTSKVRGKFITGFGLKGMNSSGKQ